MKRKMDQVLLKSKLCSCLVGINGSKILKQKISEKITIELMNTIYNAQIEAVLEKSKLYNLLVEINDPETVKQELSNKITTELVNIILNLDMKYLFENLKFWNDLFYLQIDNIEEIREKFVREIYEKYNYTINLDTIELNIKNFIANDTCINCSEKCKDSVESAEKGHLDCLKFFCNSRPNNKLNF